MGEICHKLPVLSVLSVHRFCELDSKDEALDAEAALLRDFDYAANYVQNNGYRQLMWDGGQPLVDVLEELAWCDAKVCVTQPPVVLKVAKSANKCCAVVAYHSGDVQLHIHVCVL